MSKVKESEHLEFINDVLRHKTMSLQELVIDLRKKGFKISKSALHNHSKELAATINTRTTNTLQKQIDLIKSNNNSDNTQLFIDQDNIIKDLYANIIESAYISTIKSLEHDKVVSLHHFKVIKEIQGILINSKTLIEKSKEEEKEDHANEDELLKLPIELQEIIFELVKNSKIEPYKARHYNSIKRAIER